MTGSRHEVLISKPDSGSPELCPLERGQPPRRGKRRRQRRNLGPVVTPTGEVFAVDEAEVLKVIIWADSLPGAEWFVVELGRRKLMGDPRRILRVRIIGEASVDARRAELICVNRNVREEVLDDLRREPLNFGPHKVVRGRTWAERRRHSPPTVHNRQQMNQTFDREHKHHLPLGIGHLNTNGLSHKLKTAVGDLNSLNLDLVAVTEVLLQSKAWNKDILPGYTLWGKALAPFTKRGVKLNPDSHGVGFLMNNNKKRLFRPVLKSEQPKFDDMFAIETLAGVEIEIGGKIYCAKRPTRFLACYIRPNLEAKEDLFDRAISEISTFLSRCQDRGMDAVIMGDLNCNLRSPEDPLRQGQRAKPREPILRHLFASYNMQSLHTLVDAKLPTYHGSKRQTMIDYILVNENRIEEMSAPSVAKDMDLLSDHWLIHASAAHFLNCPNNPREAAVVAVEKGFETRNPFALLRTINSQEPSGQIDPAYFQNDSDAEEESDSSESEEWLPPNGDSPVPRREPRQPRQRQARVQRVPEPVPQPNDDDVTWERRLRELVVTEMGEQRHRLQPQNPQQSYSIFDRAVFKACSRIFRKRKNAPRRNMPSWLTKVSWEALVKRRKAYKRLARITNNPNSMPYQIEEALKMYNRAKKETRAVILREKKRSWNVFYDSLKTLENPRTFWKNLKRAMGGRFSAPEWGPVKSPEGLLIPPEDPRYISIWRDYWSTSFAQPPATSDTAREVRAEITQFAARLRRDRTRGPYDSVLSLKEVTEALTSLPGGKAPGWDAVSYETLKAIGPVILTTIFNDLWKKEIVPEEWDTSILMALPKSGDLSDLNNSRGISLMSNVCKLFGRVLLNRLKPVQDDISKEQVGYRTEVHRHIYSLVEICQARRQAKKNTYLVFIDFSKAFDRVDRNRLLWRLDQVGVKGKMLRYIQKLLQGTKATVRVNGNTTTRYDVNVGTRQGDVLSPLLFNIFLDDLLPRIRRASNGIKVTSTDRIPGLGFADDLVFICQSIRAVQSALGELDKWLDETGMIVTTGDNAKSAVMMVPSGDEGSLPDRLWNDAEFRIEAGVIPKVNQYKYLGLIISKDLKWDAERDARKAKVEKSIQKIYKVLVNRSISVAIRLHAIKAFVLPVAMFGAEFWCTAEYHAKKIQTTLCTAYQRILNCRTNQARIGVLMMELGEAPIYLRAARARAALLTKWTCLGFMDPIPKKDQLIVTVLNTRLWGKKVSKLAKDWTQTFEIFDKDYKQLKTDLEAGRDPHELKENHLRLFKEKLPLLAVSLLNKMISKTSSDRINTYREVRMIEIKTGLCIAPYLTCHHLSYRDANSILFKIRTGTIYLNNQISHFGKRTTGCLSCGAMEEDLKHFLSCPATKAARDDWRRAWNTEWGGFFPGASSAIPVLPNPVGGVLNNCTVYLSDNPVAFAPRALVRTIDSTKLWLGRAKALQLMWRIRSIVVRKVSELDPPSEDENLQEEAETGVEVARQDNNIANTNLA